MRKKLLLLLVLVAVLTSGCIKADLKLDVKDDGSGTYTALLAVNAKLFQQLGGLSALDPSATADAGSTDVCKQMMDSAKSGNPTGAKIDPYKDGDFCGFRISASFANIDEGLALLNGSSDSSGGTSLENVTLEKAGSGWNFSADWNPSSTGDSAGTDAALTKQFLQGFSFVIRIKLPGGQVTQNADLIEGDGTMVWNLDPSTSRTLSAKTDASAPVIKSKVLTDAGKNVGASGSAASTTATGATAKKSSSKTWLYLVIALVVVAGIAAIVLTKRNKTKAVPAMAGMAGMPGVPPMAPGQMMPPGQPMDLGQPMAPPMGAPTAPMAAPPAAVHEPAPAAAPSPTEPQWDAARNAYIQWDAVNSRWMQYDQTAGAWKPIE